LNFLRWFDIAVLVAALPVFIALDAPLIGYVVCGGVWVVTRLIHLFAERKAKQSLADGNRRGAMGLMAGAGLGRVWLIALAVLIVGLSDRAAGLSAALLAVALVTSYLIGQALCKFLEGDETDAGAVTR
jgi:hypothetical protein